MTELIPVPVRYPEPGELSRECLSGILDAPDPQKPDDTATLPISPPVRELVAKNSLMEDLTELIPVPVLYPEPKNQSREYHRSMVPVKAKRKKKRNPNAVSNTG